jgi:hypothetical protein
MRIFRSPDGAGSAVATPPTTPAAPVAPAAPPVVAPPVVAAPPAAPAASPDAPKGTLLGGSPVEPAPPAGGPPKAPDKYDLKLPDNPAIDATVLDEIAAYARERNLSNEHAQAIVDRENVQQGRLKAREAELAAEWRKEIATDPKYNKPEVFQRVQRFVDRFANARLKEIFKTTFAGENADLFKMIADASAGMTEDRLVNPGSQPPAPVKRTLVDMYKRKPKGGSEEA